MTIAADYAVILRDFLDRNITVDELQHSFLTRFKGEEREMSEDLFEALDQAFADIDCYTSDPILLETDPDFYLSEEELRKRLEKTLTFISN